jgi:rhodanese-related sulfurtransferase
MVKSICFIFILFACQSVTQDQIESINAERLKELQKEGVEVIDIRTPGEYLDGHIVGVPNIDFMSSDFEELISLRDKDKPLIIHCASGGRSKRAAEQLSELGFTKLYDYSGGFSDWKRRGEEIEK